MSCTEIDFLVEKAIGFDGVYGSRLTGKLLALLSKVIILSYLIESKSYQITGGGFGGCTVTLVAKSKSDELINYLRSEYNAAFQKSCDCFVTSPGAGARLIPL